LVLRRRPLPSVRVDDWAALCVKRNSAPEGPFEETIAPDVTVRRWRGATPASDVAFYRVEGGGHTWPGARVWSPPHLGRVSRTLDATRLAWEFLEAHRLQ